MDIPAPDPITPEALADGLRQHDPIKKYRPVVAEPCVINCPLATDLPGTHIDTHSRSGQGLPLYFKPHRVYVLDRVWQDPLAAARAERFCSYLPEAKAVTFALTDLPDIVAQEKVGVRTQMGQQDFIPPAIPFLVMYDFDRERVNENERKLKAAYTGEGDFAWSRAAGGDTFRFFCSDGVYRNRPAPDHVCRPQWRINQGIGCPHQCRYCHLGYALIAGANVEEYVEHLAQLVAQNPWQKTYLYDDIMDVLTTEPALNAVPLLMKFFQESKDYYLILHTKSDRIEPLIEAGYPKNTIIAWSLSTPSQSRLIEPMAGTCESRIEAARLAQRAGMTVRFKFKPIVPLKNWRYEADLMMDLMFRRTRPDNLSATVLMWKDLSRLLACIPAAMMEPDFVAEAEKAADELKGDRNGPFPEHVREQVYRHYLACVRKYDADVPFTISTESLSMWQRLGPTLGVTPANYVCGCGAGSTPGRKRLDTSPWSDAQAARTWDGLAATPGCS
jgi:hypothetical protein